MSRAGTDEIAKLKEQLQREKKLKEKAFGKIESLRESTEGGNDLVWQRKYFEAASELQRTLREMEQMRIASAPLGGSASQQDDAGSTHPHAPSMPTGGHPASASGPRRATVTPVISKLARAPSR